MSTNKDGSRANLAENVFRSTVKVHKVTYEWAIDNFDFCEANGSDVFSPKFSANAYSDVQWYLALKPNGETDSKDTIGLYLHVSKNKEQKTIFAKFWASILNNEREKKNTNTLAEVRKFDSNGWGWGQFCKKDANFRKNLLSNNVLKIFGEIIFSTETGAIKHQSHRNSPYPMSNSAHHDVIRGLDILFNTHLLSDVVVSVKTKEYPAHKAILAARSKVFAAMFEHDTKENQLNRIEIEDLSEETVAELLRFIYTGRCENLYESARGLLAAADKYDLDPLKTICIQALCDHLSVENAAQILILADMHCTDYLKNQVINFIVSNPTEVFSTDDWKNVETNPRLIGEVCRAMARR